MADEVTIQITGSIARISLNRPSAHNLITPAVVRGLELATKAIRDDDSVRCVIISGGPSFSAGWDLDSFAGEPADALAGDVFGCLATLPQPIIAAIEGDATGGGLALALAADIRIAAEDATFAFPEIESGLIPLAGSINRLVRLTGRGSALSLILTGEPIDAPTALRIGLVSEVTPAGTTLDRAQEIAEQIARRGPIAVRLAKEAISRGAEMPLEQALRFETDLTLLLQATNDRAEGVKAFIEKREPELKGE
jgi:enoyl-CoA hydratase